MMPYGLFAQVVMIAVSVAMIFTYIKPSFTQMTDTQNTITVYQEEISKVAQVNEKLQSLVGEMEGVSSDDKKRLLAFMPDSVDTIAIPRDIQAIADDVGVLVRDISYEGPIKILPSVDGTTDPSIPEQHIFELSFESSYGQLKQVLKAFEENRYPLEVSKLDITKTEGGFLNVAMQIISYDSVAPAVEVEPALQ
jgi:hypothetical protein